MKRLKIYFIQSSLLTLQYVSSIEIEAISIFFSSCSSFFKETCIPLNVYLKGLLTYSSVICNYSAIV